MPYYFYNYYYTAGNAPHVNRSGAMHRRREWSSWWSPRQVLATICCHALQLPSTTVPWSCATVPGRLHHCSSSMEMLFGQSVYQARCCRWSWLFIVRQTIRLCLPRTRRHFAPTLTVRSHLKRAIHKVCRAKFGTFWPPCHKTVTNLLPPPQKKK